MAVLTRFSSTNISNLSSEIIKCSNTTVSNYSADAHSQSKCATTSIKTSSNGSTNCSNKPKSSLTTDCDNSTSTAIITDSLMNMFSFLNIQGLCPQTKPSSVPFLKDLMSTSKYLFLGLTETWLTNSHKNGELEIDNYTIFRNF